mgnify:CR=1 FL=1
MNSTACLAWRYGVLDGGLGQSPALIEPAIERAAPQTTTSSRTSR